MKLKAILIYSLLLIQGAGFIFLFPRTPAQVPPATPEQYLDSIRAERPALLAFLRKMPKGGDLHSHLSGAVYAETFLRWAAEKRLCLDTKTLTLSGESENAPATKKNLLRKKKKPAPKTIGVCEQGQLRLNQDLAANDPVLYRRMIDAWSMRNWEHSGKSGHDQFFDSFGKFGQVTDRTGEMVAEVMKRAEANGVTYLELMVSLDGGNSKEFGDVAGWNNNYEETVDKLHEIEGYKAAIEAGLETVYDAEQGARAVLKCDESEDNPGCKVTVRYICQVARGRPPAQVFAQMLMAFETLDADSKRPRPRLVGINLVQPEDGMVAMRDFHLQMEMLRHLQERYPDAKITLHAGELAPGLVSPESLKFHISESVEIGGAKRIGHGTDVLHEDGAQALFRKLADKRVMIEICLTSNDKILGVRGKEHPLKEYIKNGVPVALATDDEGVARSDMTLEYLKAVEEQSLGYTQLKKMARTSLAHAFVPGESLWDDTNAFEKMVPQCSPDDLDNRAVARTCQEFLGGNEKAKLQWELEKAFRSFERQYIKS